MKISTQEYRFDGAVFPSIWPCDVVDATGKILDCYIVYFDTDTGVVISQKYKDGIPVIWETGPPLAIGAGIIEIVELHPAPLTMIPYDPANHASPCVTVGP